MKSIKNKIYPLAEEIENKIDNIWWFNNSTSQFSRVNTIRLVMWYSFNFWD